MNFQYVYLCKKQYLDSANRLSQGILLCIFKKQQDVFLLSVLLFLYFFLIIEFTYV